MAASPPLHDAASLEKAGPGDALPRAVSPQPSVVFDADAEARLRRKIDLHILPPVSAPCERPAGLPWLMLLRWHSSTFGASSTVPVRRQSVGERGGC